MHRTAYFALLLAACASPNATTERSPQPRVAVTAAPRVTEPELVCEQAPIPERSSDGPAWVRELLDDIASEQVGTVPSSGPGAPTSWHLTTPSGAPFTLVDFHLLVFDDLPDWV